jgi:hypothetical protein
MSKTRESAGKGEGNGAIYLRNSAVVRGAGLLRTVLIPAVGVDTETLSKRDEQSAENNQHKRRKRTTIKNKLHFFAFDTIDRERFAVIN